MLKQRHGYTRFTSLDTASLRRRHRNFATATLVLLGVCDSFSQISRRVSVFFFAQVRSRMCENADYSFHFQIHFKRMGKTNQNILSRL